MAGRAVRPELAGTEGGVLDRVYMELAIWPGVCLTVVVYSLNMFGDAVRDLLDPRLKGGTGSYGAAG
ncbi:MAG: hypothetical protein OXC12_18480 [Spirochaetaceae bacterium]|nr:hypothetical protein [Spirochaetaceae bacterium]